MVPPSTMDDLIARAVRETRSRRGLSTAKLAEMTQLPLERLEALEAGQTGLCLSELDRVAEALELDRDAFALGRVVPRPSASTFFRQSPWQDYHPDDAVLLDRVMDQARDLQGIHSLGGGAAGGLRARFRPAPILGREPADAAREGHDLAVKVRRAMRLPLVPLTELASRLETRFDLTVWVLSLHTKVPALSLLDGDRGAAVIVLNANDRARTQNPLLDRVHLAHELCHLLFDETEPGRIHLVMEVEGDDALAECRARGFAAEFLMPRAGLERLVGRVSTTHSEHVALERIERARAHFGTPWEIAAWHLGNRGFVQKKLAAELVHHARGEGPSGFVTRLPASGESPARLVDAVRRAWEREVLTDGGARKALGLPLGATLPFEA